MSTARVGVWCYSTPQKDTVGSLGYCRSFWGGRRRMSEPLPSEDATTQSFFDFHLENEKGTTGFNHCVPSRSAAVPL